MISSGGTFSKTSSIVSTMPKLKARILRDLSRLEFDSHAVINTHVARFFYVPTIRWSVTHPRQLAACVLGNLKSAGPAGVVKFQWIPTILIAPEG